VDPPLLPPGKALITGEFRFAYETYHARILYVYMLTYSILAYAYPRAML